MSEQAVLPFIDRVNTSSVFRPIHYLGSKLRILKSIKHVIDSIDPDGNRVYDLFSGSGTVASMLSANRSVTAVDIQEYSRVLCSALLNPVKFAADITDLVGAIRGSDFVVERERVIAPLVEWENKCLHQARSGNLSPLCELLEWGSVISVELGTKPECSTGLQSALLETVRRIRASRLDERSFLIVRHFGGLFYSYSQASDIDALLDAAFEHQGSHRDSFLAAILSTASDAVNTVGKHFAQPLRPRNPDGSPKQNLVRMVERDRELDVFVLFAVWAEKYNAIIKQPFDHRIVKANYTDALDDLPSDTRVVYADPPYTRDHYSRFYHALETMCLRDEPTVSMSFRNGQRTISRGIYRSDRHQSPFCIRSQAPAAFEVLFSKVAKNDSSLVLSYSPFENVKDVHPRVVTVENLRTLALRYFKDVNLISTGKFSHSKLNSSEKNFGVAYNGELLIACRN